MNVYEQAMQQLTAADHILVSASNGLSISEGYHIFADNEAFQKYFGDFRQNYGVHNIIQGYFAPLPPNVHQQFIDRLYQYMVTDYTPSESMQNLKKILTGRDYFVVTSNSDKHFLLNGFDPQRLFEVEGNFFDVREGDETWQGQKNRFLSFLRQADNTNTVVFELGIGARNQLIKAPLMQIVAQEPKFRFITLNMPQEINIPKKIEGRSLALPGDIGQTFKELLACR